MMAFNNFNNLITLHTYHNIDDNMMMMLIA